MRRCLSWCIGPLLLGGAMGAATGIRAADACSPARTFWVLEKAEAQPPDALLDAAMWPQSGQLSPRVVSLRAPGSDAWVRLEYQP